MVASIDRSSVQRKKENNVSAAAQDDDGRHLGFGLVGNEFTKTESAKRKQKCPWFGFFDFELLNAIPVDCVKDDVTIV